MTEGVPQVKGHPVILNTHTPVILNTHTPVILNEVKNLKILRAAQDDILFLRS